MKSDEFRKIADHKLRHVFRGMVAPATDLPTRSELRAMIADAVPGDDLGPVREALFTKAIELAEAATDRTQWWDLRYAADHFTLDVVNKLEARERIVEPEQQEVVDLDAVVASANDYTTIGGQAALDRAKAGIPDSEQHWSWS